MLLDVEGTVEFVRLEVICKVIFVSNATTDEVEVELGCDKMVLVDML